MIIKNFTKLHNPLEFHNLRAHLRLLYVRYTFLEQLINYRGRKIRVVIDHYDDIEIIIPRERISSFKAWINR